jgi:cell wall-active antibiotic response 4TMS protein YvqF
VSPTESVPPVPTASARTTPSPPLGWDGRYEKQEKHEKNEKHEKQEKGEKTEKGRGGDLAGALAGGLILILLGLLLYLSELGNYAINWSNFWEYLLVGIGAILVLQGFVRYVQSRRMFPGLFIGGVVLITIGASFLASANYTLWPLILVVIGLGAIASAFVGRRRVPNP